MAQVSARRKIHLAQDSPFVFLSYSFIISNGLLGAALYAKLSTLLKENGSPDFPPQADLPAA